ncbi:MAG: molybdopterin-binding protein, partial [Synergistota bacterium]|nr:molybdopterin-binding protein [Synergistota bacterium]
KGYKGARFRKNHVITEEDIPVLRSMGRERISIIDIEAGEVHEDEAAVRLALALSGDGTVIVGPAEGKCKLTALNDGLLRLDGSMVDAVNDDAEWSFATLPGYTPVRRGQDLAALRIKPLVIKEERLALAETLASSISVAPYNPLNVGLVTTGKEIAEGRVRDVFRPRMERKAAYFGGNVTGQRFASDDPAEIQSAIETFIAEGADMVVCTGGMSVDADDLTTGAIRNVSDIVSFEGVPSMPGSMLMLGWKGDVAVVGAPACVAHSERTTLDRLLPFLYAGIDPGEQVRRWGVGGLCLQCDVCVFPQCTFGSMGR